MPENLYEPGCVRTFSGQYVNLSDPDPATLFPIDIAVSLAREGRFANHTQRHYSVAEHSIWCMKKAELDYPSFVDLPFAMLLHDAHEFIWRDLGSPAKNLLVGYKKYANILQQAIHDKWNVRISPEEQEIIKRIDNQALEWEWQNKVLHHRGAMPYEKTIIDTFIYHFVRLCKTLVVVHP